MKILLTKYAQTVGGGELYTLNLFRGLRGQGVDIWLGLNHDSPLVRRLTSTEQNHTIIIRLGPEPVDRWSILRFGLGLPVTFLASLWQLSRHKSQGLETIMLQNLHEKLLLTPIATLLGIKTFWIEHQLWVPTFRNHPLFSLIYQRLVSQVQKIIVFNKVQEENLRAFGVPSEKIHIIYHGVPAPHTARQAASLFPADQIHLVLGTVTRLHHEKGLHLLLEAMQKLPPDVGLVIAGDGPERTSLEHQATQLDLAHRVKFVGFLEKPGKIFQQMDVFVLPTLRDNLPLALLEAMSYGLPIVASAVGSIPEILTANVGRIVPPNNVRKLYDALDELYGDQVKRHQLGRAARQAHARYFTDERMLNETLLLISGQTE